MIKSIIIDDEESARNNLQELLSEYCEDVEIAASVQSMEEGVESIRNHQPDLLFLDIELQNNTGFDLLKEVEDEEFEVIFVTAYNQYAVKAFKYSAVDYLLKPINIDALEEAVGRVRQKQEKHFATEKLDSLMENLNNIDARYHKIALPTSDGLIFVQLKNIIRCESADNYTNFFLTSGKKIMVSKTIKHFEKLLKDAPFYRVHQSHMVNMDHIRQYVKKDGGYLIMSDGSEVMISQRRKNAFLEQLADKK